MKKTLKGTIRDLVSKNNIEQALQVLIDNGVDSALLTLAQYNRLKRQINIGTISHADQVLERNKIVDSVLYFAGIKREDLEPIKNSNVEIKLPKEDIEDTLYGIMMVHRKRNPEIISKAKELLILFRNWKDEKILNPLYDPSNKNFQIIRGLVDDLIQWISNRKEESIEDIAKNISDLFGGKIPDYYQLKEAYKLLETKGFNDQYIEKQLESEVLFLNTRIEISEKMEQFILSLLNK